MSTPIGRKEISDYGEIICIIQDQQPTVMYSQPIFGCFDSYELVFLILLWQLEQLCKLCEPRDESLSRIGTTPEHGLIVLIVAVGILKGNLGFANPTESADGLRL